MKTRQLYCGSDPPWLTQSNFWWPPAIRCPIATTAYDLEFSELLGAVPDNIREHQPSSWSMTIPALVLAAARAAEA